MARATPWPLDVFRGAEVLRCGEGKLDWVLLRRLEVASKGIGNHDYAASDHKWLSADVRFSDGT